MAKPVFGKSVRSDWFFLGRNFAVRAVSMEKVKNVYFLNLQPQQRKQNVKMVILHSETTRKS